jgi:hypothetical protein
MGKPVRLIGFCRRPLRDLSLSSMCADDFLGDAARERQRWESLPSARGESTAMDPDLIQPTIGLAFLAVWALVGQIIIRARKKAR